MNRLVPWIGLLILLLIAGGIYLMSVTPFQVDQERAVRNVVEGFGRQLQQVSLFGPDAPEAMQGSYGPYVESGLLAQWQSDPINAPGRLTSSPWPDRIEISAITKETDTRYVVAGDIIEVTNEGGGVGEQPTEAARRPVSLIVEKVNAKWLVTSVTLSAYAGDGEWTLSQPDARGIQFLYPSQLPTTYISAATPDGWPPVVRLEAGEYSCAEQERMVGDRSLCVVETSEGAAGSIYRTFEYITPQGDSLARAIFTLRYPQCMNYDEPERGACAAEQSSFDVDGVADRILSSIRMP